MSFFRGSQGSQASEERINAAIKEAKFEMNVRAEILRNLAEGCFDKCIDKKFHEGEINLGESACLDRCTSKFAQVMHIAARMLNAPQQPQQQ